jgi:small subunit ribosomal protein S4
MRRIRNKYKRPRRPWDKTQIKESKKLMEDYGLRRQKEIWIAQNILRGFRERARTLAATKNKEEEKILIDRLAKLGLLKKESGLDDVLALTLKDVLNRRLQTIVLRKGIAKTMKQSRQMIVHGHVFIESRKTTFPSYLVTSEDEGKITSGTGTASLGKASEKAARSE